MKALLKGSLILTSSNLIVRIASYFYRVLMGRALTPYEFGILNIALPLQYITIIMTSSGIAPAVAKFISEYEATQDVKKRDLIASSSLVYYTLASIFLGLFFYLLSYPIGVYVFNNADTVLPLKISSIALPFCFLVAVYTGVFQGLKKIEYMAATLVTQQALRILFAVILVYFSLSATAAIAGSTLGFILTVPVAYLLSKKIEQNFSSYDFENFEEVFYFSLPISATAVASFVLAYADTLLLGHYLSAVEVGIYSAASPTSRLILAFSVALCAVLIPSVSELKAKKDQRGVEENIKYSYLVSVAVLLPVTLFSVVFSEPIITLLFGVAYAGATVPFQILVVGTAFLGIFTVNSGILQGLGIPRLPMKILFVAAILDILLNIVLIPKYQVEGAAVASTLSFVFAGVASVIALNITKNKEKTWK